MVDWKRIARIGVVGASAVAAVFGGEVLYAIYGFGPTPPFTNPDHDPIVLGQGPPLRYVVMGDSTAAGQGAPYADGIAMGSARHLAATHRVTMTNLGVSGATAADVERDQLGAASNLNPDLVLVAVGANDVTHFTSSAAFGASLHHVVIRLAELPSKPVIVLTGSPQMGATPRFAQPLRWLAGTQTARINAVVKQVGKEDQIWIAPVVDVGSDFAADPSLYGADRFHPNSRGYARWLPIIEHTLDAALQRM